MPNDDQKIGQTGQPIGQSSQNQATSTSQPTADLQIKTPGAASLQTAPATQNSAPATPPATTTAPSPATPPATIATVTPTTPAPAPSQPTNKRAFNLSEGTETSSTGQPVPEKFAIPKLLKDKYPDLIDLIKSTESMDDQERQYWFQIMPIMSPDQIEKFRNILITEKNQLSDLDKEYEDELNRLNDKHLLEWKEFESKEKSRTIREAEAKSAVEEKKQEEDLLAKLSDV